VIGKALGAPQRRLGSVLIYCVDECIVAITAVSSSGRVTGS
jgi:hypothetical protein